MMNQFINSLVIKVKICFSNKYFHSSLIKTLAIGKHNTLNPRDVWEIYGHLECRLIFSFLKELWKFRKALFWKSPNLLLEQYQALIRISKFEFLSLRIINLDMMKVNSQKCLDKLIWSLDVKELQRVGSKFNK